MSGGVLAEPTEVLRCISVHSVKGGVGKSSLSYLIARARAEQAPTVLVDMDLTGTSLSDVLRIQAPSGPDGLDLRKQPTRLLTWREAQQEIRVRADDSGRGAVGVPFLNDFLLWQGDRSGTSDDLHPDALLWRLEEAGAVGENLRVIPSSALPRDLHRILPLIYDELHAAWLESRLEWLLNLLLDRTLYRTVVFDSPPTIPGLSRALLSMAVRLPRDRDLAEEGGTPVALKRAMREGRIDWTPLLIVSPDHQDLRAAERWLHNRDEGELEVMRCVLNFAEEDRDRDDLLFRLRAALVSGEESSLAEIGLDLVAESEYKDNLLAREREHSHLAVVRRARGGSLFRPSRDAGGADLDISEVLGLLHR